MSSPEVKRDSQITNFGRHNQSSALVCYQMIELTQDETVHEEGQIKAPEPDLVPRESIKVGGDLEFVDMDMEDETQVSA